MKVLGCVVGVILLSLCVLFLSVQNKKREESVIIPSIYPTQPSPSSTPIITPTSMRTPTSKTVKTIPSDACLENGSLRQPVKNCSLQLECSPYTPYNERFCRLQDGSCKFFCDQK